MKHAVALMLLALVSQTAPPIAHADCGDPDQHSCAGPVPTVDQVMAIVSELIDSDVPAVNKNDIVTPGFTPEEAQKIDDHLHDMDTRRYPPMNIVVSNIQSAPNNLAGATLAAYNGRKTTPPRPIVLVNQGGHWLLTHDTARSLMDAFWISSNRYGI